MTKSRSFQPITKQLSIILSPKRSSWIMQHSASAKHKEVYLLVFFCFVLFFYAWLKVIKERLEKKWTTFLYVCIKTTFLK